MKTNAWKGAAAGLGAGFAATFVMTQFQNGWSKMNAKSKARQNQDSQSGGEQAESAENSTEKVAATISKRVFGHKLQEREKEKASYAVHYSFGTLAGGFYGALCELMPQAKAGFGAGFGTALFIAADEIAVPALALSPPPQQSPLSSHVYGLLSHMVYGLSAELFRRPLRAALR